MTEETLKDIQGYERLYKISNTGKVMNRFHKLMKIGRVKRLARKFYSEKVVNKATV